MTNNRYTIYARYELEEGAFIEEVDIDAPNADEAMRLATEELDRDYDPGYTIIGCERQVGLYL